MELSHKYRTLAFEQFGETKETLLQSLIEFRKRLQEVPDSNLTAKDLTDRNLIRFLRARKLNIDNATKTILNWAVFKKEHPDWFEGLTAQEFAPFRNLYRVMAETDPLGRLVCIFPAKRCLEIFTPEYLKDHPLAMIRAHMWFVDRISYDPRAQVCGIVAVISFKDLTFWDNISLAQILGINEVLGLVHYLQDCIGLRLKSVSFYDEPAFVQYIWYFMQQLLTESMSQRFHFNGSNYGSLSEILPSYDGGGLEDSPYYWVDNQIELESQLITDPLSTIVDPLIDSDGTIIDELLPQDNDTTKQQESFNHPTESIDNTATAPSMIRDLQLVPEAEGALDDVEI